MIRKGFTLVELLIVMGIMAVLAAGIIVTINPADKIKAANDAATQNNVGQSATAAQAFAARNGGGYPVSVTNLVDNGDLTMAPAGVTVTGQPAGCTVAAENCTSVIVYGTLTSKKYTTPVTPRWLFSSSNNKTCAVADTVTVCP